MAAGHRLGYSVPCWRLPPPPPLPCQLAPFPLISSLLTARCPLTHSTLFWLLGPGHPTRSCPLGTILEIWRNAAYSVHSLTTRHRSSHLALFSPLSTVLATRCPLAIRRHSNLSVTCWQLGALQVNRLTLILTARALLSSCVSWGGGHGAHEPPPFC